MFVTQSSTPLRLSLLMLAVGVSFLASKAGAAERQRIPVKVSVSCDDNAMKTELTNEASPQTDEM